MYTIQSWQGTVIGTQAGINTSSWISGNPSSMLPKLLNHIFKIFTMLTTTLPERYISLQLYIFGRYLWNVVNEILHVVPTRILYILCDLFNKHLKDIILAYFLWGKGKEISSDWTCSCKSLMSPAIYFFLKLCCTLFHLVNLVKYRS